MQAQLEIRPLRATSIRRAGQLDVRAARKACRCGRASRRKPARPVGRLLQACRPGRTSLPQPARACRTGRRSRTLCTPCSQIRADAANPARQDMRPSTRRPSALRAAPDSLAKVAPSLLERQVFVVGHSLLRYEPRRIRSPNVRSVSSCADVSYVDRVLDRPVGSSDAGLSADVHAMWHARLADRSLAGMRGGPPARVHARTLGSTLDHTLGRLLGCWQAG